VEGYTIAAIALGILAWMPVGALVYRGANKFFDDMPQTGGWVWVCWGIWPLVLFLLLFALMFVGLVLAVNHILNWGSRMMHWCSRTTKRLLKKLAGLPDEQD
jgi:hypothetical protein